MKRSVRFLAVLGEYRKAPDVVRTRLYYEMYDEVFSKEPHNTDLIDKSLKNFIPLKSLTGSVVPSGTSSVPAGGAQ